MATPAIGVLPVKWADPKADSRSMSSVPPVVPARTTRRFVRRVSVGLVLALLVVGIAGLVSIRFSTLRSDAVTDVIDPALGANTAAVQLATDARLAAIADEPTGLSARQTDVGVTGQLRLIAPARRTDPTLGPLLATQASAARGWTSSYAALLATPRDPAARAAEGASFAAFRGASAAVSGQLDRDRARLHAEAARLRDAARLAFGLVVLVGLVALALVGALASRFLVRPQRALTDVVERLRAGESDARAPTDEGSAEVQEIAVALNALADEVMDWRSAAAETDRLRNISLDVARTAREELTTEAVLRAIPLVGEALQADRCWLRLTIGSAFGPVVREWAREGLDLVTTEIPLAGDDPFGLAQRLWRRGEVLNLPYLTPEIDLGQRGLQGFVTATGASSLLVVPVGAGERVLGLLGWAMTGGPRGWTADEVAWAQRVAADLGRALEHAQLYEAQRELVEQLRDLDRRRDDFLSTISHELRTPLTSILGSLDSVRQVSHGPLAPELAQVLDAVGGQASRLGELIDDLLVLARIEDGSLAARQTPVAVAGIVEGAERAVRPLAEAGSVRLAVDVGPPGLTVPGDAHHLALVALNVLSNAVRQTPVGGHVSLAVRHDTRTGELLLTCADSGVGTADGDRAALFGRLGTFFHPGPEDPGELAPMPGTSLGMSVVRGIVDAHGGAIAVTSREGMGTIVTVRLPGAGLEPADQPAQREPAVPA